jgi:predicted Na+-dependent transporter
MAVAVVLVAVLELANVVAIPVWSALLLPAGSDIEIGGVIRLVVLLIALPVVAGAGLRRLSPWDTQILARWFRGAAAAGLAVVIALILVRDHRALWSAPVEVWLVAAAGTALGIALGALAGWPDAAPRRWSAALVTGVRASAPALAIAAAAFPGRADVRVGVVVFGACSIALPTLVALRRRAARPMAPGARPASTPP